jgi:capsular exopolysaccharide synthesis family protein
VTSAVPSEGKSLVAANLAVSIALGRHEHVLLVEADLRRPSLVELFGLKNSRGLTEYLLEKDELSNLLYPTGIEKVTLLPGGGNTNIPSELLSSKRMIGLLKEVKSRYQDRFIIVDSSPAHVAAETEVLGRFIDGVVLVVRYGKSARTFVRQTVEKIGREKFIGVVFNGLEGKQSPGYYYNYLKYYCDSDTKGRSPLCFWRK